MQIFPQLATGALVQYPFSKQRLERTVQNVSQDGSVISLHDIYAAQVLWTLAYQDLTDSEANALTSLFEGCEGSLQSFLFVDPAANLLLYSQDLTQAPWIVSSLIQLTGGIADPLGGTAATLVSNPSGTSLSVTQSVLVPGKYTCAFSVYLRCSGLPCTVSLTRGDGNNSTSQVASLSHVWTRYVLSSAFASSQTTLCDFSLDIPAQSTVEVFGLQVEPQPYPGTYLATTTASGIYPNSRFDMDQMTVVSTGPIQNNIHMTILSQVST